MKALSLTPLYATLLATGEKRYETRCWHPRELREETVAIHASAFMPASERGRQTAPHFREALARHGYGPMQSRVSGGNPVPRGAILALCEVVGFWRCGDTVFSPRAQRLLGRDDAEAAFGDFRPRDEKGRTRWAWAVAAVRPLFRPVPCKGRLGLWDVPPEVAREVLSLVRDDAPNLSRADALEQSIADTLSDEQLVMMPQLRRTRGGRNRKRKAA